MAVAIRGGAWRVLCATDVPTSTLPSWLVTAAGGLLALCLGCSAAESEPLAAGNVSAPSAAGSGGAAGGGAAIIVQIGDDMPPAVAERFLAHVNEAAPLPVELLAPGALPEAKAPGSIVLSAGDTASTRALVPEGEVNALDPEGYVLRSGEVSGMRALVSDGAPATAPFGTGSSGAAYGAYALLEQLGFAFLHPLGATSPTALDIAFADVDRTTSPRWAVRGVQLHTMHPLELTDLLQGFAPDGSTNEAGWSSMLPDWDRFLEWMVASGQNRAHWVLLWAQPWGMFGDSAERTARLATLVDRAHDFALGVGVDAPIRQEQQQSFRLIRQDGTLDEELAQIRQRIDYLMAAGFDYLTTESGSTEFTSTDDTRTVAWMNEVASYMADVHHRPAYIKVHASTGQTVQHYTDPDTGAPLNYNFLPHYADARLGVMPHTVQDYALDDPAPTYGNTNFDYMREFIQEEVGPRSVAWHPEAAYWVSFDVDVPLFLPVYAQRRLHDLRLLAGDEDAGRMGRGAYRGARMDGQFTFSSGWEWGYWLQEVVSARAAWGSPEVLSTADDDGAFDEALVPVTKPFGAIAGSLRDLLVRIARAERELLIEGRVGGIPPASVVRRNGQAYLEGFDTWDDIGEIAQLIPGSHFTMTQPDRLGLVEMRNPLHAPPSYSAEVEPLLAEMEATFTGLADEIEGLRASVPAPAAPLFADIADGTRLLALRATQIHGLYDYVDAHGDGPTAWRQGRLQAARDALDSALLIVTAHEKYYRVAPDRIAAWRPNPTAYAFTYLWTARTLFYWWRDEAKAVLAPLDPCYLNIINPATVAVGEGALSSATDLLAALLGSGSAGACLAAPAAAPQLPPAGLRD